MVVSGRLDALLAGVGGDRIVVEITEHDVVDAYDELDVTLAGLRCIGSFASPSTTRAPGYASFRHVLRLRHVTLTREIDHDRARRSLVVRSSLHRRHRSAIVAEGVEAEAELPTLRLLTGPQ